MVVAANGVHRIAMWSGPRNISTALLRSWENRPDSFVCDEPLYAYYLDRTGRTDHPGHRATLENHPKDWRAIAEWLTGPVPGGATVFYQKQMAHHMLPMVETDWVNKLTNCFLIREPHAVLLSLMEFLDSPGVEDTGLPQQVALYEQCKTRGETPPVIDSRDVLENPEGMLRALCGRVGVPFYDEMLCWPSGPRSTDGAWGPWWYEKVYKTSSFGEYRPRTGVLPDRLMPVLEECDRLYNLLAEHRVTADS